MVYVAFGAPYLSMALFSMVSLRVTNPDLPVCIVTNVAKRAPDHLPWWRPGDVWKFLELGTDQNRSAKLRIYELSPFEETLFLDCDTLVLGDVSPLQHYLAHFDILMKYVYAPVKRKRVPLLGGRFRYSEHGHFNSGVIGFRRGPLVAEFFATWQQRFEAMGNRLDQPSLVEAWFLSSAKVLPLPPFWNNGDSWFQPKARNEIIIWHYKVRLEPLVEELMTKAVGWFGGDETQLSETRRFILSRRKLRHHRSPYWMFRGLVTKLRGDQSRRLEKHPNKDRWLAWIHER